MAGEHGSKVEAEVRGVAGDLGVADFVFTTALVTKGQANRELGDGLLIVGALGAIIQVKAREPTRIATDSTGAANRWAAREIRKALAQVRGSRREIERRLQAGETLIATPERVRHFPEPDRQPYALPIGGSVSEWPGIIVIDHPKADLDVGSECLVVSKRDWQVLYHLLGSVSAMIRYASRVRDNDVPANLGEELDRYGMFYEQSATAPEADRGNPDFLIHPMEIEERGFSILNELAGKLWPLDNPIPWESPETYRRVVRFLDEIPPGMRHVIGAGLQDLVAGYAEGGPDRAAIMASKTAQLVAWCSEEASWRSLEEFSQALAGLTLLRHQEAAALRPKLRETLGVALLRDGDVTLEIYCHTENDVPLPDDLFAMLIAELGATPLPPLPDPDPTRTRSSIARRLLRRVRDRRTTRTASSVPTDVG